MSLAGVTKWSGLAGRRVPVERCGRPAGTRGGTAVPLSYEEGHALNRWLADNPRVAGDCYGWGPYIWA